MVNANIFSANSVGGNVRITHHVILNLFGPQNINLKFFILPTLNRFMALLEMTASKNLKQSFIQPRAI